MPMGHFENLVNQVAEMGAELISVFGYGEPLLDRTIVEKVAYCSHKGLKTFITTNGSLLSTDIAAKLLDAGLSKMRFSAHGIYDNYERVHRGLDYNRVLRNISNFIAMNKVRYDKRCDVSISVIPMNGETVDEIIKAWDGIDIEIWKPHGWGGKRNFRKGWKRKLKTCGRVHSGPIQIQADGNMIPCCFLTDAEIVLGNIHDNTIEEILKGEKYEVLRKKHKTGNLGGLPCENCDQLFILDDSPLLYSTIDPTCEINKTSSAKFRIETNENLLG